MPGLIRLRGRPDRASATTSRWFVDQGLPSAYHDEARARGIDIHELLQEKAGRQVAGESGLLALDWWNGNRSILVDAELSAAC